MAETRGRQRRAEAGVAVGLGRRRPARGEVFAAAKEKGGRIKKLISLIKRKILFEISNFIFLSLILEFHGN